MILCSVHSRDPHDKVSWANALLAHQIPAKSLWGDLAGRAYSTRTFHVRFSKTEFVVAARKKTSSLGRRKAIALLRFANILTAAEALGNCSEAWSVGLTSCMRTVCIPNLREHYSTTNMLVLSIRTMILSYFQTEDHDPDSEHERSSLGHMARQYACRTTTALAPL